MSGQGTEIFVVALNDGVEFQLFLPDWFLTGGIIAVVALGVWWFGRRGAIFGKEFEINEAEIGIGKQKIKFRPKAEDRAIAYRMWVELSTRKIGLKINLEQDVISEVYDSWYRFFAIAREILKEIPAAKLKDKSTREIVRLSVELLNCGLRPHLTRWQAKFRSWQRRKEESGEFSDMTPQEMQRQFPDYDKLADELLAVNERLIVYRDKMYELATGETDDNIEPE